MTLTDGPSLDERTVQRVRDRIGIPLRSRHRPHNSVASEDAIRHFALGYGDDNPLWCDPDYAATSVWGGSIAPPMYPISAGNPRPVEWTDEERERMSGGDPLGGMGQYMCGERWIFCRPVRPGDRLERVECLDDAVLKRSAFGGGTGALVSHRTDYSGLVGDDPVCVRYVDFWHAERSASAKAGKYRNLERARYRPEDIAALDELYEHEVVRGGERRTWESVVEGEVLGPIAKGPLTLTDMITYHIAIGWGGFGGGTSKVVYKNRRRIPKFYTPNPYGIPDSAQRCHWDEDWAQQLGHPTAYDYGAIRSNWMIHLVTNWAGDAGWLWKLSTAIRKFNYLGDSHLIEGVVVAKRDTGATAEVEIAIAGTNQSGVTTCTATATVLLPREGEETPPAVPTLVDTSPPPPNAPGEGGAGE